MVDDELSALLGHSSDRQRERERERVKSNSLPVQNVLLVRSREFSVLLYHLRPEKKKTDVIAI